METKPFTTICDDGVVLKGVLLIPTAPKAIVQFNCGTGTNKWLYLKFLQYLAENDYLCCLWDYRDTGDSAPDNLRTCNYKFTDYGTKDIPAIKHYLRSEYPQLPFFFVGHSAGGQQLGFLDDVEDVQGAVLFAVSTGYYPNMPLAYRLKAYFFFYLFSPISIKIKGYVAAKRFGLMEDLPKGVVMQWRRWLETPDYFFDKKFLGKEVPIGSYKNIPFPIHLYYAPDDAISNKKNTERFWQNANVNNLNIVELNLNELPVKKVDHLGYFRSALKETVWARALSDLNGILGNISHH